MRWDIYLITNPDVSHGRTHYDVVSQAILAGVDAIMLRDDNLSKNCLKELGLSIRKITRDFEVQLIVYHDIELAIAIEADGVHLDRKSISVSQARKMLSIDKIIGAYALNPTEAKEAENDGADYLIVNQELKSGNDNFDDNYLLNLKNIKQSVSIPVIAQGGITPKNLNQVLKQGIDGIAVSKAIIGAWNIPRAVSELRIEIENTYAEMRKKI